MTRRAYGVDTMMIRVLKQKRRIGRIPPGRGGFTLVEVLVALVITIIVIGISGSLIISSTNIFSKSAQRDAQMNIAESLLEFVSGQLLYANEIQQKPTLNTGESIDYSGVTGSILRIVKPSTGFGDSSGQLYYRRAGDTGDLINVFGSDFYHNYQVSIICDINGPSAENKNDASFTLTVSLHNNLDPSNAVLERSTTKPLLNYTGGSQTVGGAENYIVIN